MKSSSPGQALPFFFGFENKLLILPMRTQDTVLQVNTWTVSDMIHFAQRADTNPSPFSYLPYPGQTAHRGEQRRHHGSYAQSGLC